jgi:hypothetical protein
MTFENQAFATINRGSFAENIDKRLDRPDYTGDSENISPVVTKLIDRQTSFAQIPLSPRLKAIESQTLLKGLETPVERTELYDNFDIHHEQLMNTSDAPTVTAENEGLKSMEVFRTGSDEDTSQALIPESIIIGLKKIHLQTNLRPDETKPKHRRQRPWQ